ncbi:MAG: hypothetical protein KGJ57_20330 [Sphingomonadales bacterium]|nr:hypothetical protein [Sphingomonadales bacterium]
MPEPINEERGRGLVIAKAWGKWLLAFIPLFSVTSIAIEHLPSYFVQIVLALLLIATLLYQRLVRRRSWRSILWGVHVREENRSTPERDVDADDQLGGRHMTANVDETRLVGHAKKRPSQAAIGHDRHDPSR